MQNENLPFSKLLTSQRVDLRQLSPFFFFQASTKAQITAASSKSMASYKNSITMTANYWLALN